MRVGKWAVAAASIAAVVSISAFAASGATVAPLVKVSPATHYKGRCSVVSDGGTTYGNAEANGRVATSPDSLNRIVGVWEQDVWSTGLSRGVMSSWTGDGGVTWHPVQVPFSKCGAGSNGDRASDPWVSIGADGRVYVAATTIDTQISGWTAVGVSVSIDRGKQYRTPVTVASDSFDSNYSVDTPYVTGDPTVANTAYLTYGRFHDAGVGSSNTTMFSKTTNGGSSWSQPRPIIANGRGKYAFGSRLVVDPNSHALYVFFTYLEGTTEELRFVKSTNGGVKWSAPQRVNDMLAVGAVDPVTGRRIRAGQLLPDVTIDRTTGALYAVWQDARNTSGRRDEILFSRSTNGGQSWSKVVRISSLVKRPAFTPTVYVNAAGTLAVTYTDLRFMKAGDAVSLRTDYWMRTSADGGRTWSGDKHVGGPFNLRAAPLSSDRYFLGDYMGLTSNGSDAFVPFFVMTNCVTGGCPSNRTDVFASVIAP